MYRAHYKKIGDYSLDAINDFRRQQVVISRNQKGDIDDYTLAPLRVLKSVYIGTDNLHYHKIFLIIIARLVLEQNASHRLKENCLVLDSCDVIF